MEERILILDFGSQYTQLIARRIRELNVYCEIHPYSFVPDTMEGIRGIILSGSPFSVRDANAPFPQEYIFTSHVPVLGLCYGAQYMALRKGGDVQPSAIREYGRANLSSIDHSNRLMKGMTNGCQVWMSHGDTILTIPDGYEVIASTRDVKIAGYEIRGENTFGIQFHPEVYHTSEGMILLKNFVTTICGCHQTWTPDLFVDTTVQALKEQLGNDQVVLGLSGGVDSTVAGVLLHKAIGANLHCIFVDNGLLRKDEFNMVMDSYHDMGLNVTGVDATDLFLEALEGIAEPEQKRKAIGKTFIDVFDAEAKKLRNVAWLAQGTIYPDVIESVSVRGPSATIKSHHNVGGLPDKLNLMIVEPLKSLFKDEVRRVGHTLGIKDAILHRHPFPGPGLGIRIIGEVNRENLRVLKDADHIFIQGLKEHGLYDKVWQAFVVLLPVRSVGVMGDERTYENVVALRAVTSTDGMTADWASLPHDFLATISNEIINKVKGVNRVVYDISSKPPATIEWE